MSDDGRQEQPSAHRPPGADAGAGGGQQPPVLDQVFDGDSLYSLRAAVAAHGLQAGLAEGRLGDLVLAVHELAANAVRHGGGRARLRIWDTGGILRCEVTDDDAGPSGATGQGRGAGDSARWPIDPGHGLWVVSQVADQTSVQAGASGTVASVSFALGPPGRLPPFRLAQRFGTGYTVVSVTGELDLSSADQFTGAVRELTAAATAPRLVLDLSGLTGWDSSGLTALILARQQVSARSGGQMVVAGLPGHLLQRLRAAGLDGGFTLAPTVDDGAGMFSRTT